MSESDGVGLSMVYGSFAMWRAVVSVARIVSPTDEMWELAKVVDEGTRKEVSADSAVPILLSYPALLLLADRIVDGLAARIPFSEQRPLEDDALVVNFLNTICLGFTKYAEKGGRQIGTFSPEHPPKFPPMNNPNLS